jgi:hypothetical protein
MARPFPAVLAFALSLLLAASTPAEETAAGRLHPYGARASESGTRAPAPMASHSPAATRLGASSRVRVQIVLGAESLAAIPDRITVGVPPGAASARGWTATRRTPHDARSPRVRVDVAAVRQASAVVDLPPCSAGAQVVALVGYTIPFESADTAGAEVTLSPGSALCLHGLSSAPAVRFDIERGRLEIAR